MNLKHEMKNKTDIKIYNENSLRSLKAYIKYILKNNKKPLLVYTSVLLGVVLFNIITALLIIKFSTSNSSSSTISSGALMNGFISVIIMASVTTLVWTTKTEINKAFVFPINRQIYALGNFITSMIGSVIFLVIISLISLFETVICNIISMIVSNFAFVNNININNFISGFLVSLSYLMFFIALSYFLGVCFVKNKIVTLTILGVVFILSITFSWIRQPIIEAFKFFFYEKSIAISCLKLWGTAILLHIAAFIPVRNMEVRL